ncbi:MAG: adenylosuccinate lyase, partial [Bryobacterales bacterium]|nr:adenylosuccinate lyase [Bryobacterales bacterium]
MIQRYTRPEMGAIWSDENKYRQWLEVELAATETLAELGDVPAEEAHLLVNHAGFKVERIHEIEKRV